MESSGKGGGEGGSGGGGGYLCRRRHCPTDKVPTASSTSERGH